MRLNRGEKEAEKHFSALVPLRRSLVARFPDNPDYGIGLILSTVNLALIFARDARLQEANEEMQAALEVAERLAAEYPQDPRCSQHLARCHQVRGGIFAGMGQMPKAETEYRSAMGILTAAFRQYPGRPDIARNLLRVRLDFCGLLCRAGKLQDAVTEARAVQPILRPVTESLGTNPYRQEIAGEILNLARLFVQLKQIDAAQELLKHSIAHGIHDLEALKQHPELAPLWSSITSQPSTSTN